jgi:hypothetical protein
MKFFLIPKLMLISKIAMSQIMLPAYQGVVSKIPTVTPSFSCGPSTAVCEKTKLGFFHKNTKNTFQTTSQFCIFIDETQTRYSKGSDQF